MSQLVLTIDGSRFHDFKGFIQEFNRVYDRFEVLWTGSLDAFHDYLVWPDEEYILVWKHSDLSREGLGHEEMVKWLEGAIQDCHPASVPHMCERLEAAMKGEGQTMFDLLVEIIQSDSHYVQLRFE